MPTLLLNIHILPTLISIDRIPKPSLSPCGVEFRRHPHDNSHHREFGRQQEENLREKRGVEVELGRRIDGAGGMGMLLASGVDLKGDRSWRACVSVWVCERERERGEKSIIVEVSSPSFNSQSTHKTLFTIPTNEPHRFQP